MGYGWVSYSHSVKTGNFDWGCNYLRDSPWFQVSIDAISAIRVISFILMSIYYRSYEYLWNPPYRHLQVFNALGLPRMLRPTGISTNRQPVTKGKNWVHEQVSTAYIDTPNGCGYTMWISYQRVCLRNAGYIGPSQYKDDVWLCKMAKPSHTLMPFARINLQSISNKTHSKHADCTHIRCSEER